MLRSLILLAACFVPIGCCSQFGNCSTRVPPPGTGTYGAPNSYYPAAVPRTSAVTPSSSNTSLSEWRSVSESAQNSLVNLPTPPNDVPVGTGAKAPRVLTTASTSGKTSDQMPTPTRVRLNGMPVNEAKRSVAPASFQSPVTGNDNASDSTSGAKKPAAPKTSTSNGTSGDSAAIRTDSWQSRSAPAPNRFAGG